jgi:biotin/methionine sulfoxide reductase
VHKYRRIERMGFRLNIKIAMEKASLNSSHWGVFEPVVEGGRIVDVKPFTQDPNPSSIIRSIPDAVHHRSRVTAPAVRESWLKLGPGRKNEGRGKDRYVPISWERALDLVAGELQRAIGMYGNQSIFGGSYGWASAGRFHHAKSQLHRFLVRIGGFSDTRDTYSNAAGSVIVKHVVGNSDLVRGGTSWQSIVDNTRLLVMFGGVPTRNTQVTPGGVGEHTTARWLARAKAAGVTFYNISPMRDDVAATLEAEWLAPRPNCDTALMLAIAHTLVAERLHNEWFLERYCVGFDRFRDYLFGREDGIVKDAAWASALSEVPEHTIRTLARRMANSRTFIVANWSLQRSDHGEQPFWMVITLAAILGQIGLPGGGFGFGYGSMEGLAGERLGVVIPTLGIGQNPVRSFIPVARIADMLLNPGQPCQYDGHDLLFPDIRIVYWCGGNPFHHHQDLNRLMLAWQCPETIIVNEPWWTATARHADIVLPATTTLERDDIGASSYDRFIVAMKQSIAPVGQARDDFAIFSDLADRFGVRDSFIEGRTAAEFLRHLYETAREQAARRKVDWPCFDEFWERGYFELPDVTKNHIPFEDFRCDPERYRLPTPSGRIEIFSSRIASFGYEDCRGHPTWFEPAEWLGSEKARDYPLHLLTTQPATRLHAQMDMGRLSQQSKVAGREPIRISLVDAERRGIRDGDLVRVFNKRGAMLAGAVVTDNLRPGVAQISTGSWYDPEEPGVPGTLDKHGNPNVLTMDKGTSRLAQGPSAQTTLVEIEKYSGVLPPVSAFEPPLNADWVTPAVGDD